MALFAVSMYFFAVSSNYVIDKIVAVSGVKNWLQQVDNIILNFFFAFANLVLWLLLLQFYFSLFKYIWLIVGSPVFAYLSEKTESIIQGKDFPFTFKQLLKDIVRGIGIAVRNMLWQAVYLFFIILLSFIPVVGWTAPIFALIIECYYYGFSMMDYTMERRQKSISESFYFINHHRGLAIGNGVMFYLMHMLPVVGWITAPAYAVIAATISINEIETVNKQQINVSNE